MCWTFQEDDDERESQVLRDYDALFLELKSAIQIYGLDPPPLLQREISHRCFTFFTTKENETVSEDPAEVEDKKIQAASAFVDYLVKTNKLAILKMRKFREVKGNT